MDSQTPLSYWQTTVPHFPLESDLPGQADIIVIGGGILGVAACYWLAKAGMAPVLLERTMLAYGATGRNAGIVGIGAAEGYHGAMARLGRTTAQAVMQFTLENRQLLQQTLIQEEIDCDYRELGAVSLAVTQNHMLGMKESVEGLQAMGLSARLLNCSELQELIHTPLGEEVVGGMWLKQTGQVHSARLVQGIARVAQRHGARLYATEVQHIAEEGGTTVITTNRGTIRAQQVILAVNAWTGELLPSFARFISPVRGQELCYAPTTRVFETSIGAQLTPTGEYGQQTLDGTILLGGCRAAAPNWDKDVHEQLPTAEVQQALEQIVPRLFPALATLPIVRRWAGLMAFTHDYLPIIDKVPELPHVWAAGGFSGHGMAFVIRTGQLLAEAAISGEKPAALEPFRLTRPTL